VISGPVRRAAEHRPECINRGFDGSVESKDDPGCVCTQDQAASDRFVTSQDLGAFEFGKDRGGSYRPTWWVGHVKPNRVRGAGRRHRCTDEDARHVADVDRCPDRGLRYRTGDGCHDGSMRLSRSNVFQLRSHDETTKRRETADCPEIPASATSCRQARSPELSKSAGSPSTNMTEHLAQGRSFGSRIKPERPLEPLASPSRSS
jgi:hypothetical protein